MVLGRHEIMVRGKTYRIHKERQDGQVVLTAITDGSDMAHKVYIPDPAQGWESADGKPLSPFHYYTVQYEAGRWVWRRYVPRHEIERLERMANLAYSVAPLEEYPTPIFDHMIDWYEQNKKPARTATPSN